MAEGKQGVWVTVNGERFLVEVEDLHQRPIIAHVEGSRFEIEIEAEPVESDSRESDLGKLTNQRFIRFLRVQAVK